MAETVKYLLTVDAQSGVAVKIEQVGEAGELTEMPLSGLSLTAPGGAVAPPVVNIYVGGGVPGQGPAVRVAASEPAAPSPEELGFGMIQFGAPKPPAGGKPPGGGRPPRPGASKAKESRGSKGGKKKK
jgi:hypothetical protein